VAKLDENAATIEFLRKLLAQVPWGHHRLILDKLTGPARLYNLRARGAPAVAFSIADARMPNRAVGGFGLFDQQSCRIIGFNLHSGDSKFYGLKLWIGIEG
jgi:hypothetical protein